MQLNEKLDKLKEIKNYIENVDVRANNILNHLGWNKEYTFKKYNFNFEQTNNNNINKNSTKDDSSYQENFTQLNNIKLETNVIQKLLNESGAISTPHTNGNSNNYSDKHNFSREQKLKIYDFIIEKTGKLTEPEHFLISENVKTSKSNKFLSFAEIVALRRDFKRRRLKHSVGTNSPLSVTEEFRNLIELQMDALHEYNSQIINKEKRYYKGPSVQNEDIKTNTLQNTLITEYASQFLDKNAKSSHKKKYKEKKSKDKDLKSHRRRNCKDHNHDQKFRKYKRKHKSKDRLSEKYCKLKKRKKDKKNKRKVDD